VKIPQGIPDAELVRQAADGDGNAFRALVDRYKDYVFHLCLRVTGSKSDGEDMAQECFIKLFKNLRRYKEGTSFPTGSTPSPERLPQAAAQAPHREVLFPRLKPGCRGAHAPGGGHIPDPAEKLDNARLSEKLASAVAALPDELRTVFVMRIEMEEDFEAIAEAWGKSPSTPGFCFSGPGKSCGRAWAL